MRWKELHHNDTGLMPVAYQAVLKLRRHGHRVYCARRANGAETHHELDGQIVPTSWIVDMARAEGTAPAEVRDGA
ncbi:hypothetical protein [Dongia deserti]|uniref:hypothetical protein n=1 Tax=Dongia deserti TaxID=2268030 RepID=UPI000E6551B1|nr:hypothetical protein [Dongia deserti]